MTDQKPETPGTTKAGSPIPMTDGGTEVLHITYKRDPIRHSIIQDAQNADDFPEGDLHEVVIDPDEITVEGTPEGIRWLYVWLHWAKRAHRQEELIQHAQVCEEMAEIIWEAVDGDLSDRQRARRML